MSVSYREAGTSVAGYQKTVSILVKDRKGALIDLSSKAFVANAQRGSETPITPDTFTYDADQVANIGLAHCTLSVAQNVAGTWKLRLFIGESASAEEFIYDGAFKWETVAALA